VIDTESLLAPSHGASRRGWHRVADFLQCPQRFAYRHILGLSPRREPPARAQGTLVHLALMWHYLAKMGRPGEVPVEALQAAPARVAFKYEDALRIYEAYREWTAAEICRVLDVEREFAVTIGGHLHTQRFDLVVAGPIDAADDGKVYVVDHKTNARDVSVNAKSFELSGQFAAADVVAGAVFPEVYGRPYGGVIINAVASATNSAQNIGQRHTHRLRRNSLPIVETIKFANDQIEATQASGRSGWEYMRTYQCQQFGELCEYAPLCLHGKSAVGEFIQAEDEVKEVQR
jgi:RecB family exonuclease